MKGYRQRRRGPSRWLVLEGWEEKVPFPDRPDGWQARPGAVVRKRSGKKTSLSIPDSDGPFLVKVYRPPGGLRRVLSLLGRSPAFRELALFVDLRGRGVEVTLPVAAAEQRLIGLLGACCLVVRPAVPSQPLDLLLLDGEAKGKDRRALLHQYGAFAREVHDRGVLQEDFDPNNAIRAGTPEGGSRIHLVDMERVRLLPSLGDPERARSLARLLRYGRALPVAEQVRFLHGYVARDGDPRKALRRWADAVRGAWPEVVRRDRRRAWRGCLRPGRLFASIRSGRVRGIHRLRFGEREGAIFEPSHFAPVIALLETPPLPTGPIPLEEPIRTRVGEFRARLTPGPGGASPFASPARRLWREANAVLKEAPGDDLPLALLEAGESGLRRKGFILTGRVEGYRPPPR